MTDITYNKCGFCIDMEIRDGFHCKQHNKKIDLWDKACDDFRLKVYDKINIDNWETEILNRMTDKQFGAIGAVNELNRLYYEKQDLQEELGHVKRYLQLYEKPSDKERFTYQDETIHDARNGKTYNLEEACEMLNAIDDISDFHSSVLADLLNALEDKGFEVTVTDKNDETYLLADGQKNEKEVAKKIVEMFRLDDFNAD